MNYCVFNGYVENKYAYGIDDKGRNKFDFFVSVESDDGIARPLPFRCYDEIALELYTRLKVGYYVEITCKFQRLNNLTHYFVVKDLMYKAPKSENQYYVRASQLLEMFEPKNILEKRNENGK